MCKQPIFACITAQKHCINIINAAKQMAKELKAPLTVLTCQPKKCDAKTRSSSIKILNEISKECNVSITICYGDNPAYAISSVAKRNMPLHIFLGKDNGFLSDFCRQYSLAPISIVSDSVICTIPAGDMLMAN